MEDQRGTSAVTASPENNSGPDGRAEGSSLPTGSKGPGGKDAEETQGIPVPSHRIQVTAQVYMDPEAYLQVSGRHAQATRAAVPEPATETGERYERRVSQDTETWQHALTLLTGEYGAAIVIGLACTVMVFCHVAGLVTRNAFAGIKWILGACAGACRTCATGAVDTLCHPWCFPCGRRRGAALADGLAQQVLREQPAMAAPLQGREPIAAAPHHALAAQAGGVDQGRVPIAAAPHHALAAQTEGVCVVLCISNLRSLTSRSPVVTSVLGC